MMSPIANSQKFADRRPSSFAPESWFQRHDPLEPNRSLKIVLAKKRISTFVSHFQNFPHHPNALTLTHGEKKIARAATGQILSAAGWSYLPACDGRS